MPNPCTVKEKLGKAVKYFPIGQYIYQQLKVWSAYEDVLRYMLAYLAQEGWHICKISLPKRLATSATSSIQIVGVESLQICCLHACFG